MDTTARDRRNGPAIVLHLAVALLVFATFGAGLIADEVSSFDEAYYYMIHGSLGVTLLIVLVVAIVWSLVGPRPRPEDGAPRWQHGIARLALLALLFTTLAAVLFGWALMSIEYPLDTPLALGVLPMPAPIYVSPIFKDLVEDGHEFFAYAAVLLAGLHVLAALVQHYVLRDSAPRRALPGPPSQTAA